MIGLLIVSHSRLAEEFASALTHIVGPQTQLATVCIGPNDDAEKKREEILQKVKEVDSGAGVIVLTDMFGGTPSNLAISVLEKAPIEVIAGVNLPMLIKLASIRKTGTMKEAVAAAQESGKRYINVASQLLAGEKP
ncbi:MAG: PTS sugar transporter subunit IIA [Dongiaceae bacterium]